MGAMSANKLAGWALALGGALIVVVGVFSPNGPVFGTGFDAGALARVKNLAEYASLAHTTAILTAVGSLLALTGFWHLFRSVDGKTAASVLMQGGIIAITVAFVGVILGRGLNHMIVHQLTHGTLGPAQLEFMAVTIQSVQAGIRVMGGFVGFVGALALAVGVYGRYAGGASKWLAVVAALAAIAGVVSLLLAEHIHDLTIMYRVAVYVALPVYAWYAWLGLSVARGDAELVGEDAG
ncbi:MAG: hypothetical protein OXC99_10600 [Chloroflexi bacterium]|nr:hypothetical protein [Chloroflexota bacterium]